MPINSGWFVDGAGAEISRLLKTECNVIAQFRAEKMGRGILVHEWCRLNERVRRIALQRYLHSCCTLEFCSMLVSESHGLTPRKWEGRCVPDFCVKCERSVSFNQALLSNKHSHLATAWRSHTHRFVLGTVCILSYLYLVFNYSIVCVHVCEVSICSLFSCVSHYYVVQFLTQTWLKRMLQCVGYSCSNLINMLITTDFLFKWRAVSKSCWKTNPKGLHLNPFSETLYDCQTSCCTWVHKTVSVNLYIAHFLSWSHDYCPDLNPVTPLEDVLKNGSTDNALPLVSALSVTKRERVQCWCCIPAGTIPLFSRPQSGRLNWTTPPPNTPLSSSPMHTPFPPSTLQPTNQPTEPPPTPPIHTSPGLLSLFG